MQYLQVKNLQKYQPNYTDGRKLIWIRWDIASLSDYRIVALPVEGKWLFLCLICLGTELKNQVPIDLKWLQHISGINKKRIPNLIKKLQDLDVIVTKCDEMSQNVPTDRQTDRQTDIQTDACDNLNSFCKQVTEDWNALAKDYAELPQVQVLSATRKEHLKARFKEKAFTENWLAILQCFKESAWLRGDVIGRNGKPFKGGFDWLISNDNNYVKVLEGKYKGTNKQEARKYGGAL